MPVAKEQARPRKRCTTVHIDTGTTAPSGIESVVLAITMKNHPYHILARAKHFQCE
jgi:hypothetical protein